MFTGNYLVTGQDQGGIADPGVFGIRSDVKLPTHTVNGNLMHAVTFTKTKTTLSYGLNANYAQFYGIDNVYCGPNLNLSRAFAKNLLRITIGSSYNQMYSNSVKTNEVFNHRLSLSYSPKFANPKAGRLSLNISATYLQKLKVIETAQAFNEFTGNFGISYGF